MPVRLWFKIQDINFDTNFKELTFTILFVLNE